MNMEKFSGYIIIVSLIACFFILGGAMCNRYIESNKIESRR